MPRCGDKGRHLWVNVEKRLGLCYRCEASFDAPKLVMAIDGVSYVKAVEVLRGLLPTAPIASLGALQRHVRSRLEEDAVEAPEEPISPSRGLPEGFVSASSGAPWPTYMRARLGNVVKAVHDHGIGWCSRGYYKHRLIVPIYVDGKLVSFIARDMTGKAERKVLYPKGCKTGHYLFNYDRARGFKTVILTEGVFDAIRVGPRAMAVLGSRLSDHQLGMLVASKAQEVTILFDGDEAGCKGAQAVALRLQPFFERVRIAYLPTGTDPDDHPREALRWIVARAPLMGADLGARVRSALASG